MTSKKPILPIEWHDALKQITNRIFKIRTRTGYGTGFQIGKFGAGLCAVATALHVVDESHDWDEQIKLIHFETKKEFTIEKKDRVIFPYHKSDLAIIVFVPPNDLKVPAEQLEFLNSTHHLSNGVEIGWCGFPAIASDKLCFFHGYTSCYLNSKEGYLVDGVAINGVSGGPVFYINKNKNIPSVVGVITAYMANRATRDTLPGVSIVAPVSPYEDTIKFLKTLEAAQEAEKQVKEKELKEDNQNLENKI